MGLKDKMDRKKGMILVGTRGVHKGHKAVYLGDGYIRILDSYKDAFGQNMKKWVGEDDKQIFKPKGGK